MKQLDAYQKEKLTIDLVWANIFGLLLTIPVIIIFGLPYYFIWGEDFGFSNLKNIKDTLSAETLANSFIIKFLIVMLGIVVHELIHGITWARFTEKGFQSISFGVIWKMLTPYCHCKEPLLVKHYLYGAVMPAIILGILPATIAILTGSSGLLMFGIFFTVAAAGDFLIIYSLRNESMDSLVEDHPSEAGCYIYRKVEQV